MYLSAPMTLWISMRWHQWLAVLYEWITLPASACTPQDDYMILSFFSELAFPYQMILSAYLCFVYTRSSCHISQWCCRSGVFLKREITSFVVYAWCLQGQTTREETSFCTLNVMVLTWTENKNLCSCVVTGNLLAVLKYSGICYLCPGRKEGGGGGGGRERKNVCVCVWVLEREKEREVAWAWRGWSVLLHSCWNSCRYVFSIQICYQLMHFQHTAVMPPAHNSGLFPAFCCHLLCTTQIHSVHWKLVNYPQENKPLRSLILLLFTVHHHSNQELNAVRCRNEYLYQFGFVT